MTATSDEAVSSGGGIDARPRWPWWHERSTAFRRIVRTGLAVIVVALISVVFGVLSSNFTGSLGPHVAQYSTTLNGQVRIDMGPLGAIIVDSPLPLHLGVDVVVQEIPEGLALGSGNPIDGLAADLSSYSQFLANPQATIHDAAMGLVRDAVGRTLVMASVLLCLIALGRLASHGVLRKAARSALKQPGVPALAAGLAIAVVLPLAVAETRGSPEVGQTSAVLAGTPLEQARITGRLGQIVDFYGGQVVDAINANDEFYAQAEANLRQAYDLDPDPLSPGTAPDTVATLSPQQIASASATQDPSEQPPTGEPTSPAGAAPEPSAATAAATTQQTAPPTEATPLQQEPDPVTMVIVSDLHCNVGMARVIGAAIEGSQADLVVNAGDTVMAGTAVESVCINAFADAIPAGMPVVVSDGNHDSELTAEQEQERGWTVLRGEPVEVEGIRFLGDRDPTISSLGVPTRPQRDESMTQMGVRLGQVACEQLDAGDPVDILLVHNPVASNMTLLNGCAPLTINGHLHRRIGPWPRLLGLQYLSPSTAGAAKDSPTIGPLNSSATITVMRWDRANNVPLDFRIITIGTDRSANLGVWQAFPAPSQTPIDIGVPAVGQAPWDAEPAAGPGTTVPSTGTAGGPSGSDDPSSEPASPTTQATPSDPASSDTG